MTRENVWELIEQLAVIKKIGDCEINIFLTSSGRCWWGHLRRFSESDKLAETYLFSRRLGYSRGFHEKCSRRIDVNRFPITTKKLTELSTFSQLPLLSSDWTPSPSALFLACNVGAPMLRPHVYHVIAQGHPKKRHSRKKDSFKQRSCSLNCISALKTTQIICEGENARSLWK